MKPGTGHFHIVVDRAPGDALAEGDVIPFDKTHLHYGKVCRGGSQGRGAARPVPGTRRPAITMHLPTTATAPSRWSRALLQGQKAAELELASGKHTLTLQFANALRECSADPGKRWGAQPPRVAAFGRSRGRPGERRPAACGSGGRVAGQALLPDAAQAPPATPQMRATAPASARR